MRTHSLIVKELKARTPARRTKADELILDSLGGEAVYEIAKSHSNTAEPSDSYEDDVTREYLESLNIENLEGAMLEPKNAEDQDYSSDGYDIQVDHKTDLIQRDLEQLEEDNSNVDEYNASFAARFRRSR